MPLQIAPALQIAELMNLSPRSVHGLLQLHGEEIPKMVDLVGDFYPDLAAVKRIQITPNPKYIKPEAVAAVTPKMLHPQQVGTTGIMTATRWAKVPTVSEEEAAAREAAGQPVPFEWKRMLYMEWFSQNGRVVLELIEPHIEVYVSGDGEDEVWEPFVWPDTKPDDPMAMEEFDSAVAAREAVPFGQHYKRPKMDGGIKSLDDDDEDSKVHQEFPGDDVPFDPIKELERCEQEKPSELDSYLAELNRERDEAAGLTSRESPFEVFDDEDDDDEDAGSGGDGQVDDLIAEMEYMDEIMEGKHDDDPPLVNALTNYVMGPMTEGEAEIKLKEVLAQLALYGFSISICEHYDAKATLRLIRDEWGLEAKIHPGLIGSGWVRGYMTSESCRECEEEFERRYQETDHEEMLRQGAEILEEQERQWKRENSAFDDGDVPF